MRIIIRIIILALMITGVACAGKIDSVTDTYFPLVKNSYWVYLDSTYDPADEEGVDPPTPVKDSIVKIMITDTGIIADVSHTTIRDGKIPYTYIFQYLKRDNMLYSRVLQEINKKWTTWDLECEALPVENDTIIKDSYKMVYKKITDSELDIFSLVNIDPLAKKAMGSDVDYFLKGVGFIGNAGDWFSTNLIEYRIGNGPVVKKNWHLEKAKK